MGQDDAARKIFRRGRFRSAFPFVWASGMRRAKPPGGSTEPGEAPMAAGIANKTDNTGRYRQGVRRAQHDPATRRRVWHRHRRRAVRTFWRPRDPTGVLRWI